MCKVEHVKLLDKIMDRTLFDIKPNSLVFGNNSKNKQMGFPGGATGKELACRGGRHKRRRFNP